MSYTVKVNGNDSVEGVLLFQVDNEIVYTNEEIKNNIEKFEVPVEKGYHFFTLQFSFLSIANSIEIILNDIQLTRANQNLVTCKKCPMAEGVTNSFFSCSNCGINQYYDETANQCQNCKEETFSFPFSIGVEKCLIRKRCEIDDYEMIVGDCKDNKREVTFRLVSDICKPNNETNPQPYTIDCLKCPNGQIFNEKTKKCDFCEGLT